MLLINYESDVSFLLSDFYEVSYWFKVGFFA